ncbi:unnamed protein product [Allacma fusca]|uniref:[histone H3]-lysine(27) N-trimethyltransferase n=1 Tax=Allacma fusca TaxID=39272 RepID=A0A8J2P813_9HEXA|nr:unnamed protein product [Allacma fusca]
MAKPPEMETSEVAKLSEFVPLALNFAKLDLEHDLTAAWGSQVKQLQEWAEQDESMNDEGFSAGSLYDAKFRIPQEPDLQGWNVQRNNARYRIGRDELTKVKIPIIPISAVQKPPMMTNWICVDSNVRVKSRHINDQGDVDPLFDEDDDEVKNFIQSSVQNNSADMNKVSKSRASTLKDDQLFISFVKTMLDYENTNCDITPGGTPQIQKSVLGGSNVFHAVSEACPGIGFPFEVRDRYAWLTRSETRSQQKRSTVVSRSEVLEFYHKNFCRRCLLYNCLLHGKDERVDVSSVVTSSDFEEEIEPCGRSCYMLLRGDDQYLHSDGSAEQLSTACSGQECAKASKEDSHISCYGSMVHSDTSSDDDVISIEDDSGSDDSIIIVSSVLRNNFQPKSSIKEYPARDVPLIYPNQSDERVAEESLLSEGQKLNDGESQKPLTLEETNRAEDAFVHSLLFEDRNQVNEEKLDYPEILKEWSDDELSMYSAIRVIWPNNFCELARVIRTKTCFEVYKLSREKSLHTVDDQVPRKVHVPRKRKKTGQDRVAKTWFNHCKQYNLILARKSKDKPFNQPVYTPCNHPNRPCDLSICCCLQKHMPCEKFCSCFHDEAACNNLYPGCQCQGACNTNTCQCFIALRECDVDLCSCGIEKLLLQDMNNISCKNISIQLRQNKKVRKNISKINGWGLFADEPIKKCDFIGEYVGEIISFPESERRGEQYDRMKYTFLFTKDEENVVDGMFFGNLTRFINSSSNPNCYPLIKSVYGNLRIGLYANKNIAQGEELLFDYMKVIKQQMKNTESSAEVCIGTKIAMKSLPSSSSTDVTPRNNLKTPIPKTNVACKSVDDMPGGSRE